MKLRILMAAAIMVLVLASMGLADALSPLALNNESIGGTALNQYTPGVQGGIGVNNIGLLIRTWGQVTYVDPINKFFYINDGANRFDGAVSGIYGVRCSYDNLATGVTINPPAVAAFTRVTGIRSTIMVGAAIQPNIRPRSQADIQ